MTINPYRVFLGWDPSQMRAWVVASTSLYSRAMIRPDVRRISMPELRAQGLYTRPTEEAEHGYLDVISGAPMSTGHAIARFLVPALCHYDGWALFTDGDVLVRKDIADLFALADPACAVQVVQHHHDPAGCRKMTGETQTAYPRKNWSSVVLWNCGHVANRALTVDLVNALPGRDLHRFCWLEDGLIGVLPAHWNYLVDVDPPMENPALVHFTEGVPDMPGYEHVPFADEWYATAKTCGYRLTRPVLQEVRRA